MNDKILTYQPRRNDSLISCLVADGMVRAALIDGLDHFGIGYSWGGFESLALPVDPEKYRTATTPDFAGPLVRLQIGLEDVEDLIADLARGLDRFRAALG